LKRLADRHERSSDNDAAEPTRQDTAQARRDVQPVHPRDDITRPLTGVFSTRSPDRPNPIGLHDAQVIAIDGMRVQVRHLEALNGTPILDVKPALPHVGYELSGYRHQEESVATET
jgi:tRNA (Thr-GGU) A37 N-methylase